MEPVYIKQKYEPTLKGNASDDSNTPFNFKEWKERMALVNEGDSLFYYNQYIIEWFGKNKNRAVSDGFILRQKYLFLLDQLQLFFSEEEQNYWYAQILLQDERELLTSIPYFARRLRDIALYYLSVRKKIKNVKKDFSSVGTNTSIEQQVYYQVMEAFSSNSTELTPDLSKTVSWLPNLQKNLAVQVEELYDDKQYFDISPTKPIGEYFDLMNQATAGFLATKGLQLSSSQWLFETLAVPLSSNFNTVFSDLTGRIFEVTDTALYTSFVQKFIGQSKNSLTVSPVTFPTREYEVEIAEGNNFFYYPYGRTTTSFNVDRQIPLVALSSLDFLAFANESQSPTAGLDLPSSDVIFVRYGKEMKGAWLRYQDYIDSNQTVKASFKKDSLTTFVFPFPGYGLSGVDFPWTGYDLETTAEYDFMSRELKALVNDSYYTADLPVDTCYSIALNNTTLASNGANAGFYPFESDQIFIRPNRNANTTTPLGSPDGAWLYKFLKTSIAISPLEQNVFVWPYGLVDQAADIGIYKFLNYENICSPVGIAELPTHSFNAATTFELADKIYKLNSFGGDPTTALECAWLSGVEVNNGKYVYIQQDGFNALFTTDEPVRFVWSGPTTKLSELFANVQHKEDCPLAASANIEDAGWTRCTCKQVYHSPFGHPYSKFEDGNNFADCIAKVPRNNLDTFDFSSWVDASGNTVFNSTDSFAWYKTNSVVGWGDGSWVSNVSDEEPFMLETGACYFFKRADNKITLEAGMPSYIVNYNYNTKNTKWILAKKDGAGDWNQFYDIESTMILNPGEYFKVERGQANTSYSLSAYETQNATFNSGSIWAQDDNIPYVCGQEISTQISWPLIDDPNKLKNDPQSPGYTLDQLESIYGWTITRMEDGSSSTILGQPTITFAPPMTGTYCISVTAVLSDQESFVSSLSTITATSSTSAALIQQAMDADLDGAVEVIEGEAGTVTIRFTPSAAAGPVYLVLPNENTFIPCISSYAPYSIEYTRQEFTTQLGGFVLEHDLKGWDYSLDKYDGVSQGAKPYWAFIDIEKTETTRFKGLYSWGFPNEYIDEYLPNNNPVISPLFIQYGNLIDFQRNGSSFSWVQPIVYREYKNTAQWCTLSADYTQFSNLSGLYFTKKRIEPIVYPTTTPSDILLSNYVDGAPLEIYYNALQSFTWLITATIPQPNGVETTTQTAKYLVSQKPWESMQNRFFPTVANVPVLEETYTIEDVGGYFLPKNLGASLFINKEYDSTVKPQLSTYGLHFVDDPLRSIGGRGRSSQDQETVFDWTENNQWLKEGITTGNLAGSVKRNLTKTLQTFIPYQSNDENTPIGILNTDSRISPWGGYEDSEWTDLENQPTSFTGIRNVAAWGRDQLLKQVEKTIDQWTSDIFGNQYGLYKQIEGVSVADRKNVNGDLWVRTNAQKVLPAIEALSSVFAPFNTPSLSGIYTELTEFGIKEIKCYYDTLYIRTESAIIFAKVGYNFEEKIITSKFDDTVYLLLDSNFRFESNWFFSKEKKVVTLFSRISGVKFYPELWQYNLTDTSYNKHYPTGEESKLELLTTLDAISAKELRDSSLYYNRSHNIFLLTYTGIDLNDSLFMLDMNLLYQDEILLSKANYYIDLYDPAAINEPPIVLPQDASKINNIPKNTGFSVFVPALNFPNRCNVLTYTTVVNAVTATGGVSFTGNLSAGLYHVNYALNNNVGSTTYCLTLSAL